MSQIFLPAKEFKALLSRGEGAYSLAEAALLVARSEYPVLPLGPYLAELDRLTRRVQELLPINPNPRSAVGAINRVLFEEEGFVGNRDHYYDPRNSFLNEVLERRTGIPLTLSIIYLEIANRVGLPIVGLGWPGHFVVQYRKGTTRLTIDPFSEGKTLTVQAAWEAIRQNYRGYFEGSPLDFEPASPEAILTRLLINLRNIYLPAKSYAKALSVIEGLRIINPQDTNILRDRGIIQFHLKNYPAALLDLEAFLKTGAPSEDREDVVKLVELIRRWPHPKKPASG